MEKPERMWNRLQSGFVALLVAGVLSVVTTSIAQAKVVRVIVEHRSDVLGGRSFGDAGPYEKLVGRVLFVFDSANPYNARIVDLENAPRNADGMVEAWANFVVLRPKNRPPGGRTALLEVSNRGGKLALYLLNNGSMSLDPTTPEDFGDGLVFRLGLTVMWVGWQHDIPERDDALRIHIPTATANGRTITGLARSDWTVDETVSTLGLGHFGHRAYPVASFDHPDNVLTVRDGRMAQRRVVPRNTWRFAREASGRAVEDSTSISLDGGFQAGKIYELVYRARDPQVVGLGLAALRDFMAYAKYDPSSPFPVDQGLAIGISQTGRLLRQFVYQGFNTDEEGRQAYDGLLVLVASAGRGHAVIGCDDGRVGNGDDLLPVTGVILVLRRVPGEEPPFVIQQHVVDGVALGQSGPTAVRNRSAPMARRIRRPVERDPWSPFERWADLNDLCAWKHLRVEIHHVGKRAVGALYLEGHLVMELLGHGLAGLYGHEHVHHGVRSRSDGGSLVWLQGEPGTVDVADEILSLVGDQG